MSTEPGKIPAETQPPSKAPEANPDLAALYREAVVSHAAEPVGYKLDISPTHCCELDNPLCGDRVEIHLRLDGDLIKAAAFNGESCAICMASASMLCEAMPGRQADEIPMQHQSLQAALKDKDLEPGLESLLALMAVRRYPARIRCALLPWEAAVKALKTPL